MPVDWLAVANAGGLILLSLVFLTGQAWTKPAVEFIQAQLTKTEGREAAGLARESKLADALRENTATMRETLAEVRGSRPAPP